MPRIIPPYVSVSAVEVVAGDHFLFAVVGVELELDYSGLNVIYVTVGG